MDLVIISGAMIVIGAMVFTNYVIDKDEEEPPSLLVKLWLVPLLSLLLISPIVLFALFYWGVIKAASFFQPIAFTDNVSLGAGLLLIIAFLVAEVVLEPVATVVFSLLMKRKPYWAEKNIFSILFDTLVIYFVMDLVPTVEMKSWMTAFSISVIVHLFSWLVTGIASIYKQKKGKN